MTTPLPRTIILPTGQVGYLNPYKGTYTTSRSYGVRMQRGFDRGLSQQEARGQTAGGLTEAQWRRLRRLYVDEINELSWEQGPNYMNVDIEGNRSDPRIFRSDVRAIVTLFNGGYRDPAVPSISDWQTYAEWRLAERLNAIQQYKAGNTLPGKEDFFMRSAVWPQGGLWLEGGLRVASGPPIEFWYYH